MSDDWKVRQYNPIKKLEDNLWLVEGEVSRALRRVMTVAKMKDGRLVVHNAVAMNEPDMEALDALGEVGFIIVPNSYHRIDGPRFKQRYPKAKVIAPSGSREKIAERVLVDGTFEDFPTGDDVALEMIEGVKKREGIMTVRSSKGTTLVLTDLIFNMPHVSGVPGFFLRHITASSGGPTVSRLSKIALISDKKAVQSEIKRLADLPLTRVIVAHHETITDKPADALRAVADTL